MSLPAERESPRVERQGLLPAGRGSAYGPRSRAACHSRNRSAQTEVVRYSDQEALEIDWPDKIAFIYATLGGSPFLRDLGIGIPLSLADDGIHFGAIVYGGEGVSLISCLPNPFNAKLSLALVVANRPEDLIGASMRMGSRSGWNTEVVESEALRWVMRRDR